MTAIIYVIGHKRIRCKNNFQSNILLEIMWSTLKDVLGMESIKNGKMTSIDHAKHQNRTWCEKAIFSRSISDQKIQCLQGRLIDRFSGNKSKTQIHMTLYVKTGMIWNKCCSDPYGNFYLVRHFVKTKLWSAWKGILSDKISEKLQNEAINDNSEKGGNVKKIYLKISVWSCWRGVEQILLW